MTDSPNKLADILPFYRPWHVADEAQRSIRIQATLSGDPGDTFFSYDDCLSLELSSDKLSSDSQTLTIANHTSHYLIQLQGHGLCPVFELLPTRKIISLHPWTWSEQPPNSKEIIHHIVMRRM
jgi:hypothetical protein